VSTPQGRSSAIWRGLAGGVIVALIAAGIPPPIGFAGFLVFAAITVGMYFGQAWAARAGVVAAFAPIVTVSENLFATLSQCVIVAYFFLSAWRGLKARDTSFRPVSAAGWLALSLAFVALTSYCSNRVPVQAGILPPALQAGDWVLLEPVTQSPRPGQIVLLKPASAEAPQTWKQVQAGESLPPPADLQVAKWILWSDASMPGDARLAFYTKARWGRFPKRLP
jgi:hypothetical protein